MNAPDTTQYDRRLMAQGHTPLRVTASLSGADPRQHLYLHLATTIINGGNEQILAYEPMLLDFAEQAAEDADMAGGDLHVIRILDDGPATIERLLDGAERFAFGTHQSIAQIAAYAGNFLKTYSEPTPEDAATRAVANLERAGAIDWFNLHGDIAATLAQDAGRMDRDPDETSLTSLLGGSIFEAKISLCSSRETATLRYLLTQLVEAMVTLAHPMYVES